MPSAGSYILSSPPVASDITALAGGAATLTVSVDEDYRHWSCAVEYYDDAAGGSGDVVRPTAGTETYTVQAPCLPNEFHAPTNNVLNTADTDIFTVAAPLDQVRCVLASVSGNGVTHVRLRVVGATS